ncbi:MAG: hypothetical protein ACRCU2_27330, partial [Planktothrix sp.]
MKRLYSRLVSKPITEADKERIRETDATAEAEDEKYVPLQLNFVWNLPRRDTSDNRRLKDLPEKKNSTPSKEKVSLDKKRRCATIGIKMKKKFPNGSDEEPEEPEEFEEDPEDETPLILPEKLIAALKKSKVEKPPKENNSKDEKTVQEESDSDEEPTLADLIRSRQPAPKLIPVPKLKPTIKGNYRKAVRIYTNNQSYYARNFIPKPENERTPEDI